MNEPHEPRTLDSLAALVDEIARWLDRNKLRTFWGSVDLSADEAALRSATWNPGTNPNWRDFLTLAKDLGAEVVFIDRTILELDEYLRVHEFPESGEVRSLVKLLRSHDGEILELELQWMWGQVLMRSTHQAAWSPSLEALERLSEGEDSNEYEDSDEEILDAKEVERRALALAKDPAFQAARTNAQRGYSARKLFADDALAGRADLFRIIEEAKSIYEVDLKPKLHADLMRKIEGLKERGATRAQIARQLGLSSDKVKDLGG